MQTFQERPNPANQITIVINNQVTIVINNQVTIVINNQIITNQLINIFDNHFK